MNIRLIEHRKYNSIDNNCTVQILSNDGYYSRINTLYEFNFPKKYKNMDNVRMSIGTNCIVIDHLFHHIQNNTTILVCMKKLDDNKYTLIQNNPAYIKLIKGKIPEPHK